ncbi:MAG: thioesterase family protein [Planctomycetia bacterium]|nr:thioesterase family protein [Planctomycetia bacterium]
MTEPATPISQSDLKIQEKTASSAVVSATRNDGKMEFYNASELKPKRELTIDIRVRYTDCDPMRVVHHSKYFVYFEMARTELYRANGGSHAELEEKGHFFVVVRTDCHYIRPALYDDIIQVNIKVERVTRAKIIHRYEIWRDGELLTEAHITLALINRDGQVLPIPEDMNI